MDGNNGHRHVSNMKTVTIEYGYNGLTSRRGSVKMVGITKTEPGELILLTNVFFKRRGNGFSAGNLLALLKCLLYTYSVTARKIP